MSLSFISFLDYAMPPDLPILKIANMKLYTIDVRNCTEDQLRQWLLRIEDGNVVFRGVQVDDVADYLQAHPQFNEFVSSRNVTACTKGDLRTTNYLNVRDDDVLTSAKRAGYLKAWSHGYRQACPPNIGEAAPNFFANMATPLATSRNISSSESREVNIRNLFGLPVTNGLFGIEIEIEGSRFPLVNGWEKKADGSLRGESAEYVLTSPLDREAAVGALNALSESFKECKTVRNYSYRTSVHVHVNVQTFKRNRLNVFLYLANLFEDALINFAGPNRLGNRFCLSNSTSMGNVRELENFVSSKSIHVPSMDVAKYMAINIASLNRFGSIEFRMMEGNDNVERISSWLHILEDLYKASNKWETIKDVAAFIEKEGFRKLFIKSITLKNRKLLSAGFDVEQSLLDAYKRLILLPHKEVKYD